MQDLMIFLIVILAMIQAIRFLVARQEAHFQFLHQLAERLDQKEPLPRAVERTALDIPFKPLRTSLLSRVLPAVREGTPLSGALKKLPALLPVFALLLLVVFGPHGFAFLIPFLLWRPFSPHDLEVLAVGEASGCLPETIRFLSGHEAQRMRGRVDSRSPFMLGWLLLDLLTILLAVIFLSIYILPTFGDIFEGMQLELPVLTKLMLAFTQWIGKPVGLVTVWSIVVILLVAWNTPRLRDGLMISLPVFRPSALLQAAWRFVRGLDLFLRQGMPVPEALERTRRLIDNTYVRDSLERVCHEVGKGISLAEALRRKALFPPITSWMIDFGERTGKLPEVLCELAEHHAAEIPRALSLMERQLLLAGVLSLGCVTAWFVFGALLPLVQLVTQLFAEV